MFTLPHQHAALKHIDYSYSATDYVAQGQTYHHVIALAESIQQHLTTQPAFLIKVSRAQLSCILVTDDKTRLIEQLVHHPG